MSNWLFFKCLLFTNPVRFLIFNFPSLIKKKKNSQKYSVTWRLYNKPEQKCNKLTQTHKKSKISA